MPLSLAAGLLTAAVVVAAPAQAEPTEDAFLAALTTAGVGTVDPANAVALGQSVCPMLTEPGQTAVDVAAKVAEVGGMSLGGANLFTGIAISMFCPAMVSSIGTRHVTDSALDTRVLTQADVQAEGVWARDRGRWTGCGCDAISMA